MNVIKKIVLIVLCISCSCNSNVFSAMPNPGAPLGLKYYAGKIFGRACRSIAKRCFKKKIRSHSGHDTINPDDIKSDHHAKESSTRASLPRSNSSFSTIDNLSFRSRDDLDELAGSFRGNEITNEVINCIYLDKVIEFEALIREEAFCINMQGRCGKTPLECSLSAKNIIFLLLLIKHPDIEISKEMTLQVMKRLNDCA